MVFHGFTDFLTSYITEECELSNKNKKKKQNLSN